MSADALIADLWGDDAPSGATSALQGLVSRLRKALGGVGAVELVAGGYRLPVGSEDVDAHRFEELVARGRRELAGALRDLDAGHRQARERGLRRLETTLLNHRAAVLRRSGEYRQAHQTLDRLETLIHRVSMPEEVVRGLITGERVSLLLAEGEAVRARELLPRAVWGAFAYGNPGHLASVCEWLGRLLALEGDPKGAAHALGMSERIKGPSIMETPRSAP